MIAPILTDFGKAAFADAIAKGGKITIERVELGSGSQTVTPATVTLAKKEDTCKVADSVRVGKSRVQVSIVADNDALSYAVREMGFVAKVDIPGAGAAQEGFIWIVGGSEILAQKLSTQELRITLDFEIAEISADTLKLGVGERLNLDLSKEFASLAATVIDNQKRILELSLEIEKLKTWRVRA